ncbi:MAG: DsbA family protein, partial [Pseudomonadota bacterium]|nr:DsbA family protein [Pseudomonadota bacterium]
MNSLAPAKARLPIEVVHDLVCPWCYLGVRRLFRTMRRRPDLLYELTWRPFLLNPDMPRLGMTRSDYVIRKFGGEDRA